MLPRGYKMDVPFPPGSGRITLSKDGETIRTFPYVTSDATIIAAAKRHAHALVATK